MNIFRLLNNTNNKGFTLVELLLVVALIGVSVGVTTDILLSVTRNYSKTQVLNEVEQQANFVSLKLTKELRNARNIIEPTLGSAGNSLHFSTRDGNEIKYYLDENVLYREEIIVGLDPESYPVTSVTGLEGVGVECAGGCFNLVSENPDIIGISMVFKKANTSPLATFKGEISVEDTIVLRGTY